MKTFTLLALAFSLSGISSAFAADATVSPSSPYRTQEQSDLYHPNDGYIRTPSHPARVPNESSATASGYRNTFTSGNAIERDSSGHAQESRSESIQSVRE